jgi:hypothetical protein
VVKFPPWGGSLLRWRIERGRDYSLHFLLIRSGQLLPTDVIGHFIDRAGELERQCIAIIDSRARTRLSHDNGSIAIPAAPSLH